MALRKRKALAPSKRPVPAYMMSYGDMMTLLLTFFILLVSMAREQRAGLVAAGTGSFAHAVETLGLPGILPGGRKPINLGNIPPNYTIPTRFVEPDDNRPVLDRDVLESPRDRIQKAMIDYLRQSRAVAFSTAVAFEPGTDRLVPSSLPALDAAARLAEQTLSYVGVETDVAGPGDGWVLSARRAAAVARYLHARGGIPYDRIGLAGYGRFRPISDEGPRSARDGDERVSLILSPKLLD